MQKTAIAICIACMLFAFGAHAQNAERKVPYQVSPSDQQSCDRFKQLKGSARDDVFKAIEHIIPEQVNKNYAGAPAAAKGANSAMTPLSKEQLIALLGEPDNYNGPQSNFMTYYLKGSASSCVVDIFYDKDGTILFKGYRNCN